MRTGAKVGLLVVPVLLAAAVAAGALVLRRVTSGEYLAHRLDHEIQRTTGGLYHLRIDSLQVDLKHGFADARGLSVDPQAGQLELRRVAGVPPSHLVHLSIDRLRIEGIRPWASYLRRGLSAARARIAGARLSIESGPGPSAASPPGRARAVRHGGGGPFLAFEEVQLEGASVEIDQIGPERTYHNTFSGISARLDNVRVDPRSRSDPRRVFYSRAIALQVERFERTRPDGNYRLEAGPIRVASRDSLIEVRSFDLRPAMSEHAFRMRNPKQAYIYIASAGRILLAGWNGARSFREGGIVARSARIDDLKIDVDADMRYSMYSARRRVMPNEAFQKIGLPVRIDTVRVERGDVRFSEVARDGTRPGAITFSGLGAVIGNVTNDPRRMTEATPATVDAVADVGGAGRLRVEVRIPLLAPRLDFRYRARSLGGMDVTAFNSILVPVAGTRISSGRIDTLWVDATARADSASGTLHAIYRDLAVQLVDKNTGQAGLGRKIKALLANTFVIRKDNLPGRADSLGVGRIGWRHASDEPFFGYWWRSLRSGMFSLAGLGEVTPPRTPSSHR